MPKHISIYHTDKLKVLLRLVQKASYQSSIPNYTTISRRINRLNIKIDEYNKQKEKDDYIIIVAIDSTGIKITSRGE